MWDQIGIVKGYVLASRWQSVRQREAGTLGLGMDLKGGCGRVGKVREVRESKEEALLNIWLAAWIPGCLLCTMGGKDGGTTN